MFILPVRLWLAQFVACSISVARLPPTAIVSHRGVSFECVWSLVSAREKTLHIFVNVVVRYIHLSQFTLIEVCSLV